MEKEIGWSPPPACPAATRDEVHLWMASLERPDAEIEAFRHALTPDEHKRAERFTLDGARRQWIAGRGLLRCILSRYAQVSPESVRFLYGARGKPYLLPEMRAGIQFNMSDSRGVALFAITREREVGVDIEFMRDNVSIERMARRYFTPTEAGKLLGLPSEQWKDSFFSCWTRKEAFIKAIGVGLSFGLGNFEVSLIPSESPAVLSVRGSAEEARRWTAQSLDPAPGYRAAVIAEGGGWALRTWRWE